MANIDQAEGLRRMLESPKPRVMTFVSALREDEKSGMLVNLAVSLARQGQTILMVDARASHDSVGAWLNADQQQTLLDVARQQRTMQEAIRPVSAGLSVTMLSRYSAPPSCLPAENLRRLSRTFDLAVHHADLVLVDSDLDAHDAFPLACLDDSDVVVQVSANPLAIKAAYGLIKRMNNRIGRRAYSIVVSGATEQEARLVFSNMAQAANRYLAVPLHFMGYVPDDDHMKKAARLGRSVIDAFPLAGASQAFCRLAEQLTTRAASALHRQGLREMGVHAGS